MIEITQSEKMQLTFPAPRVNNGAVTCAAVDHSGFDYAVMRVAIGATDIGFTTFKLQESDDNSTFTDVPGTDFSISPLSLPSSSNSDTLWEWQIDLRGSRMRYLRPSIVVGNGTLGAFLSVSAELYRAEQAPFTAAAQGLVGVVAV